MQIKRKRRIYFIVFLVFGVGIAASFVLFALKQNIDLYYTPQQTLDEHLKVGHEFRLGGMVVQHSVHHVVNSLQVSFELTDFHQNIWVEYVGILPTLFREGQGIVAQGHLNEHGIFVADQVLAKHDSNYRPPNISVPQQESNQ